MGRPSEPLQSRPDGTSTRAIPRYILLRATLIACLFASYRKWSLNFPHMLLNLSQKPALNVWSKEFSWHDIQPTTSLKFRKCFGEFECARSKGPMDWRAPHKAQLKRVAIAMLKLPAKVPVTDPRYGCAIFVNPGGPGGSGVELASHKGHDMQNAVDWPKPPTADIANGIRGLCFDIIGFDPRGVKNTTPTVSCFPDDFSRMTWHIQKTAQGLITSNASFAQVYNRLQGWAQSCSKEPSQDIEGIDTIGKYMSTPYVVQDIVAMAEAHGERREAEAKKIHARSIHTDTVVDQQSIVEKNKWKRGDEKILYFGFSYGTLLGATLATMHPGRIHRVVLDGVVDAQDYHSGQ